MSDPAPVTGRPTRNDALPQVSVIVPVRDGEAHICRCLAALVAQTYPRELLEILVVDNGSRDTTPELAAQFPVTLLREDEVRSPYAARNRGVESAQGHVLAFTDADCAPDKDWLMRAVDLLWSEAADLVGGRVRFSFSDEPTASELLDSLNNVDSERSIAERGVAKTGNLVVRRRVFTEIGLFPGEQRSGGDIAWTGHASGAGFCLLYAPEAVVIKPARRLRALLRKQYRVGRGQYHLWRSRGRTPLQIAVNSLQRLRLGRPSQMREALRERGPAGSEARAVAVWSLGWVCGLVSAAGRLRELVADARQR